MCFDLFYYFSPNSRLIKSKIKPINFGTMSEINRKRLKELLKIPENSVGILVLNQKCLNQNCFLIFSYKSQICADCQDSSPPNYASITIGVFLCASCVQIHRKLGTHVSRTKSLTHDVWDSTNVSFMEENGNAYCKSLYEKYLPPYYRKPLSNDSELVDYLLELLNLKLLNLKKE